MYQLLENKVKTRLSNLDEFEGLLIKLKDKGRIPVEDDILIRLDFMYNLKLDRQRCKEVLEDEKSPLKLVEFLAEVDKKNDFYDKGLRALLRYIDIINMGEEGFNVFALDDYYDLEINTVKYNLTDNLVYLKGLNNFIEDYIL